MKKISLFLISLIIIGCSEEYPPVSTSDSSNSNILYVKDGYGYGNNISFRIEEFVYDNHEYIMMRGGYTSGIVHNPDCEYCKEKMKRDH